MKETVYIETSVVSYYTARPSRDLVIAGHQQITREWWDDYLPDYDGRISPLVIDEAEKGDANAAKERLRALKQFQILEMIPDVLEIAQLYIRQLRMPTKAEPDALHLAFATFNGLDFMVSWNCQHIVNGHVRKIVKSINNELGYETPEICTPEELMEV